MTHFLPIAVWQCAPSLRAPGENLRRLREVAAQAAGQGARVLVTPEATITGYDIGDVTEGLVDGAVDEVVAVSRQSGLALVVGVLRIDSEGRFRNSSVVADGDRVVVHDKAHLFGELDMARFVPGDRTHTTAVIDGVTVATVICYEVEFPEVVRAAALDGAQALLVPTANMVPFTEVNDVLVPARAIENAVPVVYANHCGREGGTEYVGRSVVVGFDGGVLARATADDEELLVVDVPLPSSVRADAPGQLRDRRPDLYRPLVQEGRS